MAASGILGLKQIEIEDNDVYWCEMRPSEKGRNVIVKHNAGEGTVDVTSSSFNARTRVHEYGGGAYKVFGNDVFFTNFADQKIYKIKPGRKPKPITMETKLRHADFEFDNTRKRLICVREDHTKKGKEAKNTIVSMGLEGEDVKTIAQGSDFYSSPRISPNGKYLAYLSWNHPSMPWDKTSLWMGKLGKYGLLDERIQLNQRNGDCGLA